MDRYRRTNMRFRANTLPEESMSRRNREYKDVVQKLVGRQSNAARGSPDQQRKQQQRQMLHQLRQHVSEARFETGEAVSHIQDGMNKMEARLSQSSMDSEEGVFHGGNPNSMNEKYQSDTLRAMQELVVKRRQSELDETHVAVEPGRKPEELPVVEVSPKKH
ncbi:uncharacterized protein LOC117303485 isoform X1 [Asterias rubens]|uniref:uncharacterized protein LOC117303485 isoform X1 n=2 Tax=Asterias rubens TaxID=7604 RepID=UPI0014559283|nr:uncharacterized protein LOC117303485 isoform X1 [Asterias rubens]